MDCKGGLLFGALGLLALTVAAPSASAQKNYGPGVTDSEIKLGTTTAFSGPASAYSTLQASMSAYFAMINEKGGINGRKINLIAFDDAYSPPKTVEQTRKLIEGEEILFLVSPLGTATSLAVIKYLNQNKVPTLFIASGASVLNDPEHYPWTLIGSPHYASEGEIFAKYLLKDKPNAKIGILWQNDDFGKDYLSGFKRRLGDQAAKMIVAEQTYNVTDPTVASQVVSLKAAGADVLFLVTTAKASAQAIRTAWEIDWHPLRLVISSSSSIASVIEPAGFDASKGVISEALMKDPRDPQWANDPEMKKWNQWMEKYNTRVSKTDYNAAYAYNLATAVTNIIKMAGDDLTRENIMNIATHLDMELPLLLPGIKAHTTSQDHRPFKQMYLTQFNGERFVLFGDALAGE